MHSYAVTSTHIHLFVRDSGHRDAISNAEWATRTERTESLTPL